MVKIETGAGKKKDKILSALLTAVLQYEERPFRAMLGLFRRGKTTKSMVLPKIRWMVKQLEK